MNRPKNQLNEEDRNWVMKYAFSLANGNHILRYTEEEYRDYLTDHPKIIADLFKMEFINGNLLEVDNTQFDYDPDEIFLALKCDKGFKSSHEVNPDNFNYKDLLPWQQAVIDFTHCLVDEFKDLSSMLESGSRLEMVYAVFVNNLELDSSLNEVCNKEEAINRGLAMYQYQIEKNSSSKFIFEKWETELF